MFGWLDARCAVAFATAFLMTTALTHDVRSQSWEMERESGVGGGSARQALAKAHSEKKEVGVRIVIDSETGEVVLAGGNEPVDVFGDDKTSSDELATTLAAALGRDLKPSDVARALSAVSNGQASPKAGQPATSTATSDVRSAPPTAADLLGATTSEPIVTSSLEPAASDADAGKKQGTVPHPVTLANAAEPDEPQRIETAQFAPNAAAEPKAILPPRLNDAPAAQAPTTAFLPSPRRPTPPAALQQVMLSPNLAESVGDSVLRTAPTPDNALVELVETPPDYSLEVSPGSSKALKLGKPVADVFVADPNIADVNAISPTQVIVHGNKFGRTNIFGFTEQGDIVVAIDVDVVADAGFVEDELERSAPDAVTNVDYQPGTGNLEGSVDGVAGSIRVDEVSNRLNANEVPVSNNTTIDGSQQVNIRVRFAEVSRSDVFNLGINWEALVNTGDFLFGIATGPGILPEASPEAFGSIFGDAQFGDVNVNAFIDALQREGIVNLLAEPNLTAKNGQPASFLAGGEVPIPVPGGGGGETVTIEYKQFGVSLDFIPTLLPGDRINLQVRPEVSSISGSGAIVIDGFAIPAFNTRRADTSVDLASGQTFAVAGLFQRDLTTDTDKFPILGDVPVLGQLFQSQRFQRNETELVILITPYLVEPTSDRNIALPNDRLDIPLPAPARKTGKRAGFLVN